MTVQAFPQTCTVMAGFILSEEIDPRRGLDGRALVPVLSSGTTKDRRRAR